MEKKVRDAEDREKKAVEVNDDDDDVCLDKLQTRSVKKSILYM
jgi:hypothetical protein